MEPSRRSLCVFLLKSPSNCAITTRYVTRSQNLEGLLYLLTVGLFGLGIFYDYWNLNTQISELNVRQQQTR